MLILRGFFYLYLFVCAQVTPVLAIPKTLHPPRPPRPDHNEVGQNAFYEVCGIEKLSHKAWDEGMKEKVIAWATAEFESFRPSEYSTFPIYLRDKYAPAVLDSQLRCDGVGECSIVDCHNLHSSLTQHDKQMAAYVFEMLMNVNFVYKGVSKATTEVAALMGHRASELVRTYSNAERLEKAALDRQAMEQAILSAVTGTLIISGAVLGGVAAPAMGVTSALSMTSATVASLQAAANTANIIGGAMVNVNSFSKQITQGHTSNLREDTKLYDHTRDRFQAAWADVADGAMEQINVDIVRLMRGNETLTKPIDILDLINSGEFIDTRTGLYMDLRKLAQKHFHSVAVNAFWMMERAYIIDTDSRGPCEHDSRGPSENKVCLPEHPGRTYFIYSIDHSQDGDSGHDSVATVKGPPGYRNFIIGENRDAYELTKNDIVRSSLWVRDNKLEDMLTGAVDVAGFSDQLNKQSNKNLGAVPGAFTLPICRNPTGESISSVWTKDSMNYPCMCGEWGWDDGRWNLENDQTQEFLIRTGLRFSEDWEHYCSHKMDCYGENDIDIKPFLNLTADDPKIPHDLKHPFRKCTDAKEHEEVGEPHMDFDWK